MLIVQLTVLQGTELVAKDRNLFGKKTTSDPYVEVWVLGRQKVGKTATKFKTLSPTWNQSFPIEFQEVQSPFVLLKILDEDKFSEPDSMGVVKVAIPIKDGDTTQWYDIPSDSAKNATGRLQVRLQTTVHHKKFLKINGVVKLNPEYKKWKEAQSG
jgi:Ca2+-dependent lipid-binding protein